MRFCSVTVETPTYPTVIPSYRNPRLVVRITPPLMLSSKSVRLILPHPSGKRTTQEHAEHRQGLRLLRKTFSGTLKVWPDVGTYEPHLQYRCACY